MRIRIVLIFVISILIPTALLAYFGLQAVRSEKAIVERNMRHKYEAMADVVEGEIKSALGGVSKGLLKDKTIVEAVLVEQTALFKDEVAILDRLGRPVGGAAEPTERPALVRRLRMVPYSLAVYERYPPVLEGLEKRRKGLSIYVAMIAFSAFFILAGGGFTLWALSREWRLAVVKSTFVSQLSHELRRPLTSIRMFSEMLQDNRVSAEEKKKEYYDIIASESEQLTHLANNILDFSRIDRKRKKYDFRYEDIARVTADTVERFKRYMMNEARPVSLNVQGLIGPVKMDPSSISQAIMNLLINAAKYSPAGAEITVNVLKRSGNAVVEVVDKGIGIPRKEQKKIFKMFYRVSNKRAVDPEGSGLGLTLVRYAALAHKGRVEVESEVGCGSKFSLVLPM